MGCPSRKHWQMIVSTSVFENISCETNHIYVVFVCKLKIKCHILKLHDYLTSKTKIYVNLIYYRIVCKVGATSCCPVSPPPPP